MATLSRSRRVGFVFGLSEGGNTRTHTTSGVGVIQTFFHISHARPLILFDKYHGVQSTTRLFRGFNE
mgnify:CR=1 FL=1